MMKNLILLVVLSWVSYSFAKPEVARETTAESESYKIEKPVQEQDALRSVAGDRIKKKKHQDDKKWVKPKGEPDSDVRYWEYSE